MLLRIGLLKELRERGPLRLRMTEAEGCEERGTKAKVKVKGKGDGIGIRNRNRNGKQRFGAAKYVWVGEEKGNVNILIVSAGWENGMRNWERECKISVFCEESNDDEWMDRAPTTSLAPTAMPLSSCSQHLQSQATPVQPTSSAPHHPRPRPRCPSQSASIE